MTRLDQAASLIGATVGGGFAGSGCGAASSYAVVPLVIRYAAGGQYPGKSAHVQLVLICIAAGVVTGAGVGFLVRLRWLRRGPVTRV